MLRYFFPQGGGETDSSRDAEHGQQDHPPAGGGGTAAFRDDKQDTMVVRPYPQVQAHGQPQATPQAIPIQAGTPVTVAAPPVHLPQGQPAVLTEGQMKVMSFSPAAIKIHRKACRRVGCITCLLPSAV